MDFFTPVVAHENLHPTFRVLIGERGYSPALGILTEMMNYFDDVDGNFVQQFQTGGFDSRVWELYLYALFTELGYGIDRKYPAPDYHCRGLLGEFLVEATTVNRSDRDPKLAGEPDADEYFNHYVPIKFGSALFSKLQRRYWELPHATGLPLLFAIQDFHAPHSMTWSSSGLAEYLYGIRQTEKVAEGIREVVSTPLEEYRWNGKTIPAGFFRQPNSEHVSAVIANPNGTLPMFNRIGFLAGFGDPDIVMLRTGWCYRKSVFPEWFTAEVCNGHYEESWHDGLAVYHNPNARIRLDPASLPGAAHLTSKDGRIVGQVPRFHPVGTTTSIIVPEDEGPRA